MSKLIRNKRRINGLKGLPLVIFRLGIVDNNFYCLQILYQDEELKNTNNMRTKVLYEGFNLNEERNSFSVKSCSHLEYRHVYNRSEIYLRGYDTSKDFHIVYGDKKTLEHDFISDIMDWKPSSRIITYTNFKNLIKRIPNNMVLESYLKLVTDSTFDTSKFIVVR